eukprot:maker-scaffold300_size216557-snap-gene-0.12 protein:Tk07144 transcript:maker-scaffold300_size216557-snap-gene-0.12-mRNA-1 annotation:"zinc metalloproteinase nas-12 precursor"
MAATWPSHVRRLRGRLKATLAGLAVLQCLTACTGQERHRHYGSSVYSSAFPSAPSRAGGANSGHPGQFRPLPPIQNHFWQHSEQIIQNPRMAPNYHPSLSLQWSRPNPSQIWTTKASQQWTHSVGPWGATSSANSHNINANQVLGEPDKALSKWNDQIRVVPNSAQLRPKVQKKHKMKTIITEGDIATDIEETLFRLGIRWDIYPKKRWKNNTIPYKLSQEYGTREITMIESALKSFQFLSCLQFEHYNGSQADYLYIHHSKTRPGCWSYVGRRGGRQELSLRPPDAKSCHCLCDVGRTLHEVMHAMGFYHEHSRPDRDQFIDIVSNNVRNGKMSNFRKKTFDTTTADFSYDYDSIMHYGPYFFRGKRNKRRGAGWFKQTQKALDKLICINTIEPSSLACK